MVPDYRTDKIRERQVQFILIAVHMGGVSKTFLAPNFAGVHRKAGPPYPGPAPRRPSLPLDNTVIFPRWFPPVDLWKLSENACEFYVLDILPKKIHHNF